jgi:hypothetical protein
MKKLILLIPMAIGLIAATSYAGDRMVSSGKESKAIKQTVPEETCFQDREFQLDLFGQYSVGEGPHQAGVMRDHGWGGGLGLNYFFMRQVGIGVDAAWLDVKESTDFQRRGGNGNTALHTFSGSLIVRFPIDHLCLAPYIYGGGGFEVDGKQWGSGHAGVGLEYRIKPNKVGLFVDGRWTYLGDRDERHDLNFFSARAGIRLIF